MAFTERCSSDWAEYRSIKKDWVSDHQFDYDKFVEENGYSWDSEDPEEYRRKEESARKEHEKQVAIKYGVPEMWAEAVRFQNDTFPMFVQEMGAVFTSEPPSDPENYIENLDGFTLPDYAKISSKVDEEAKKWLKKIERKWDKVQMERDDPFSEEKWTFCPSFMPSESEAGRIVVGYFVNTKDSYGTENVAIDVNLTYDQMTGKPTGNTFKPDAYCNGAVFPSLKQALKALKQAIEEYRNRY